METALGSDIAFPAISNKMRDPVSRYLGRCGYTQPSSLLFLTFLSIDSAHRGPPRFPRVPVFIK